MKIAVFGASGKIGSKVIEQLTLNHEIIKIGSRSGDFVTDYTDAQAVHAVFEQLGELDAVVVVVGGDSMFKPYHELSDEDFRYGAERKLVAQFRITRIAGKYLKPNGSITLTSGFLSHYPNGYSIATGPFNAAIDAFVQHTAPLLKRGLRLNVVSPAPVVEPERVGRGLVSAEQVANDYVEAIEGNSTGKVFRVWGGLPVSGQ
ncbi:short chain dehydrogenase [Photobacterium chitinilyticum]|uniref:Short chain dehydrogenase n=1 Tax=Photobacterium chitinilyticum TaxID=2485123 RepID=A0A444JNJ5_9GAMM|nr:short chain dehydrogenase [Photobacterium chitinilyticum]RWX54670.1 short chain dehydrogenase [Photobacterium chitinilyticum]